MFKKVLFLCLSSSMLWISGCLPGVNQVGSGDSSVLDINLPDGAKDITLQFTYIYGSKYPNCNIKDINTVQNIQEEIHAQIKKDCIQKGSYTITLSLTLNGKSYYGQSRIEQNQNPPDDIPIKILLTASDGSKAVAKSTGSSGNNSNAGITAELLSDDDYVYVAKRDGYGRYILKRKNSNVDCTKIDDCRMTQYSDDLIEADCFLADNPQSPYNIVGVCYFK